MKRTAFLLIVTMIIMSLSPVIAQIPSPNSTINGETLSVDGFVTTKYASVGSEVEILAHTRGHTSSTQVTAEILRYDMDPIQMINGELPLDGSIVDTVVLQRTGVHENDASTMTWQGVYVVPVTSLGGTYGASIMAEHGITRAVDDPTQITKLLLDKFETKVLQPFDTAWDTANPLGEIKSEFDSLESVSASNGGWSNFVSTATEGSGPGGSEQLWNNMIDAGHNQYDMSGGANFLEALMEFLDSEDADAGLVMITSLLLYGDEFPLPRVIEDFGTVIDYMQAFDPIENFTRFEGTGDFENAYNALLGSNEWNALKDSIENLANNQLPFQSIQNIMHNIALLAVSAHPEAIMNALETWAQPLIDEDIDSMTPIQKLIVRLIEMGEPEIQDLNGDEIPDDEGEITWEYELLLDTSEGQAWTAKMESSAPWVNEIFDDFNSLPEDIVGHVFTSVENPAWENVGESVEEFGEWFEQSSSRHFDEYWHNEWRDDDGDGQNDNEDQPIIFGDCEYDDDDEENCDPEIKQMVTSIHDRSALDIGISMEFSPEDWWAWEEYRDDVPDQFSIAMTNNHGDVENTDLEREGNDFRYYGRLTASTIEDAEWSFTQPLINFVPPCDDCKVGYANIQFEKLMPSLLESAVWENNDEMFIVSAVGVLVSQDETTNVNSDYNVKAVAYSHSGPIEGAEVDLAIIRASPQVALDAVENFEIEGDILINTDNSELIIGNYDGDDIDGDLEVEINPRGHDGDDIYLYDQLTFQHSFQAEGNSQEWAVDISNANGDIGIAEVTTSGKTNSGIEFERTQQVPMPGTPDCMFSSGWIADENENRITLQLQTREWESDNGGGYDTLDVDYMHINWGDGQTDEIDWYDTEQTEWIDHDYDSSDNEYDITIEYKDENANFYYHYFVYKGGEGFERTHDTDEDDEDNEENTWYSWDVESFEWGQWEYCRLNSWDSNTPSPAIIDSFITDGPLEVMKEEILTSDSNGEAIMTVTPTLPGAYMSIAQVKVTRADGEKMIGVGMNLAAVTEGSIAIGGDLDLETTFGGIPVYSSDRGNLKTGISIAPSNIPCEEGHKILAGLVPLHLGAAFPGVPDEAWMTQMADDEDENEMGTELEFSCSDTAKNWEVGLTAPMYMFGVVAFDGEAASDDCYYVNEGDIAPEDGWFVANGEDEEHWVWEGEAAPEDGTFCPDSEDEDSEDMELFPNAMHIGIILNNPDSLKLNGELGPGQTTNIALSDEDGPASRILAIATPKEGFDPATIDFSAMTEFVYGNFVREEIGWIANEAKLENIRIESDAWCEDRNDWNDEAQTSYGETNVRLRIRVDQDRWSSTTPPDASDAILKNSEGHVIPPIRDWYQDEWNNEEWYANYEIDDTNVEVGDFKLILDEHINDFYIDIGEYDGEFYCNDIENSWHETNSKGNEIDTEEEIFELIDELLSNVNSVAWGQGSSADLHLPILSSPVGEYTIIAIAQKGEGDSATIVSAINDEVIVPTPNPEPPEIEDIFLSFNPPNPQVGDTVTISVVDESNQPVSGLSVTGKKDSWTIFSMVTDNAGQAEFIIQEGTIDILVTGGNYNPAVLTIIVDATGTTTEDGETLPTEEDPLESNQDVGGTTNETTDDTTDDTIDESGSDTGLSSTLEEYKDIFLITIGILVVIIAVLFTVMKIRGRETDSWADDSAWDDYQDIVNSPMVYDTAPSSAPAYSPPGKPSDNIEGQWRDGYEVLEYPSESGSWWYRDAQTGQWMEWQ